MSSPSNPTPPIETLLASLAEVSPALVMSFRQCKQRETHPLARQILGERPTPEMLEALRTAAWRDISKLHTEACLNRVNVHRVCFRLKRLQAHPGRRQHTLIADHVTLRDNRAKGRFENRDTVWIDRADLTVRKNIWSLSVKGRREQINWAWVAPTPPTNPGEPSAGGNPGADPGETRWRKTTPVEMKVTFHVVPSYRRLKLIDGEIPPGLPNTFVPLLLARFQRRALERRRLRDHRRHRVYE